MKFEFSVVVEVPDEQVVWYSEDTVRSTVRTIMETEMFRTGEGYWQGDISAFPDVRYTQNGQLATEKIIPNIEWQLFKHATVTVK